MLTNIALISGVAGALVSIGMFVILLMKGIFTLENRLTKLETKMEPLWKGITDLTVDTLRGIRPTGNPISLERWQELLDKLHSNSLTHSEAQELNTALLEQQEEARRANDLAKLLAIGLGLVLLAALLANKKDY